MNKNLLVAAVAVVALTGCMDMYFVKRGATPDQTAQDERECDYEAARATANIRSGLEAGSAKYDLRKQCMAVRGYVYTSKPELYR